MILTPLFGTVLTVAVATGPFGVDELQSADAVAADARQLGERLRDVLS